MKKIFLFTMLALFSISLAKTQNTSDETELLPLVREGVKWVNEKVIINHGDTTKYYYIYEIKGDDLEVGFGHHPKLCHYYTGSGIDTSNDSIISSLEENAPGRTTVDCFNNWPLEITSGENRNIIKRNIWADMAGGDLLYFIDFSKSSRIKSSIRNYVYSQTEPPILTEENFIEVEPIEIEGYLCPRVAYVNELGEPKAYIIKGIGFDSRNMGDLLTPFTREPDPDADYQEYCGLCHVVKDGQIIYKGMRYTPDNMTGLDEVVTDQRPRQYDDNYYNLMGQAMGKVLPTTPGIYIHHGKKVVIR